MAAIDWFFRWSPTSESMHQAVLSGLFRHTRLLELLGIEGKPTDLQVEAKGRLYDFTVPLSTGVNLNIELKVNAALKEAQIRKQMEALGGRDLLMYVLLGVTRFVWRHWRLEDLRLKCGHPADQKDLLRVDLDRMLQGVNTLAAGSVDDPDQRDLAVAYGSLLRTLRSVTDGFRDKPLAEWGWADWHGFYGEFNDRLNLECGGQDTVNPPGGNSFVGYWWDWSDLPLSHGAEAYLQLEQERLCFKVSVSKPSDRKRVRDRFSEAVISAAADKGLAVERPARFGSGQFMTSAKLTGDYRGRDGRNLDWDFCESTIENAMDVLERAVRACGG